MLKGNGQSDDSNAATKIAFAITSPEPFDEASLQSIGKSPGMPVSILVVDDSDLMRLGLTRVLNGCKDFQVVSEACDGYDAVCKVKSLLPDVVLLDIGLPGIDGIETAKRIKEASPATRLIMLTAHEDTSNTTAAFAAGADGYILKDQSIDSLSKAIKTVMSGYPWIDPRVAHCLKPDASIHELACTAGFVQDDIQFLKLLEQGLSVQDTADRLAVPADTLRIRIRELIEKLCNADENHQYLENMRTKLADNFTHAVNSSAGTEQRKRLQQQLISVSGPEEQTLDGRYKIGSVLGKGGTGIVYSGVHLHMQRKVAIKVLYPHSSNDLKCVKRFQQESRAASALKHANIASVHDFGLTEEGHPYLVMDHIDGDSLEHWIRKKGGMTLQQYLDIFMQVCDALAATHIAGLVHCDLKPSNIMVEGTTSSGLTAKLVDFGLAVSIPRLDVQGQDTENFEVQGSPLYMSPEQCQGNKVDYRTDIYSLGCIMYEAFTGKPVFDCINVYQLFSNHIHEMPLRFEVVAPDAKLPEKLESIIFHCLEKKTDSRYFSASAIKNDLRNVLKSTLN